MRKNRIYSYVGVAKFDSRNKVPYSAVTAALSHILQQILSEEENEISSFYEHLKISLGAQYSNVGLITDFVPEFKTLLDLDPTISNGKNHGPSKNHKNLMHGSKKNTKKKNSVSMHHTMDDMEARTRFHNLYVEIFRAITYWRMTTLVIYYLFNKRRSTYIYIFCYLFPVQIKLYIYNLIFLLMYFPIINILYFLFNHVIIIFYQFLDDLHQAGNIQYIVSLAF